MIFRTKLWEVVCNTKFLNRNLSISIPCEQKYINIGIVGSGPAAFYTAKCLLEKNQNIRVDMFEKMPVPFGLVRFGVSPDHPNVKNVINTFTKTASNTRFRLYGNVNIGRDLSFKELVSAYNVVVLAYGNEEDRHLGIPGEDLKNVFSARQFVGWYNGVPELSLLNPDLSTETAVVVGQGNVALDVARILISPIEILEKTDITSAALDALRKSSVKKVWLIGRRGPLQVAFTTKEFREMVKLPGCGYCVDPTDFDDVIGKTDSLPRRRKRLTELMLTLIEKSPESKVAKKYWGLKFLRSPLKIIGDAGRVKSVVFGINKLEGEDKNAKAVLTDSTESIDCGLVLKSIGYRGVQIDPDIPFDHRKGVIQNDGGRVTGVPGVYCTGWIQRGPEGVIATTVDSSYETGEIILFDIEKGNINLGPKQGSSLIDDVLSQRGVEVVNFEGWKKIDEKEKAEGRTLGKPREKLLDYAEMVKVAKSL